MNKRERIFISGPYTPEDSNPHTAIKEAQENVSKAIEVANRIIEKGHYVFVPHLYHYIHIHHTCKRDYGSWWYENDITFIDEWATAIFYIDASKGTKKELKRAKDNNLKVYKNLDEVPFIEESDNMAKDIR